MSAYFSHLMLFMKWNVKTVSGFSCSIFCIDRTAHRIHPFVSSFPYPTYIYDYYCDCCEFDTPRLPFRFSAFETVVGCRIQNSKQQTSLIILKKIPKYEYKFIVSPLKRYRLMSSMIQIIYLFILLSFDTICTFRIYIYIQVGSVVVAELNGYWVRILFISGASHIFQYFPVKHWKKKKQNKNGWHWTLVWCFWFCCHLN